MSANPVKAFSIQCIDRWTRHGQNPSSSSSSKSSLLPPARHCRDAVADGLRVPVCRHPRWRVVRQGRGLFHVEQNQGQTMSFRV